MQKYKIKFYSRHERNIGFTLIEVIAALTVMSVATTIIISLLTSSLSISEASRNRKVAGELAEEKLIEIVNMPGSFSIPEPSTLEPGVQVEIAKAESIVAPSTMPTYISVPLTKH